MIIFNGKGRLCEREVIQITYKLLKIELEYRNNLDPKSYFYNSIYIAMEKYKIIQLKEKNIKINI